MKRKAARGVVHGSNKLRTYMTFKHNYVTEQYVHIVMHKRHRSAYAKFRCGVAPIKIDFLLMKGCVNFVT